MTTLMSRSPKSDQVVVEVLFCEDMTTDSHLVNRKFGRDVVEVLFCEDMTTLMSRSPKSDQVVVEVLFCEDMTTKAGGIKDELFGEAFGRAERSFDEQKTGEQPLLVAPLLINWKIISF